MTQPEQNDDAWIEAIAQNYKHEPASPFELNTMEAKIRRDLQKADQRKRNVLPAFAAVLSLLFFVGAIVTQTNLFEVSEQQLAATGLDEPTVQLFSNYNPDNDHETYLPDDYITISQVIFD